MLLTQTIPLHRVQADFRRSPALYRGMVGGIGCGKSWIGSYDLIRRAKRGRLYMVVAPTYGILCDATIRSFHRVARQLNCLADDDIRRSPPSAILSTGAEVLFRSADDPERLRGPNLSGMWIDEAGGCARETFTIGIGRLREAGEQGWLSTTFTPKGKQHWTYDVFGKGRPNTQCFHARTRDNPFNPPGFEETLAAQYGEGSRLARQELGGEFVDWSGGVFHAEWFKLLNESQRHAVRCRYWDKAATDDGGAYTVGVLMAKDVAGRYIVEDVVRRQLSALGRDALIRQTADLDKRRGRVIHAVEQEPGSSGKDVAEGWVRMMAGHELRVDRVTGDKVTRAQPFASQAEGGNVFVLDRDWTASYLEELTGFPGGPFADQADASSGAFNILAPLSAIGGGVGLPEPGQARNYQLPPDTFR